ncbi:MAG: class I SAM-dependent methyltransferase [Candidatus Baltobacteraceae bacterium]
MTDSFTSPESIAAIPRRKTASTPIYMPEWLMLAPLALHITEALESYARGTLLDLGCGARPYERLGRGVGRWIGFDVEGNPVADVHGKAESLPFEAGSIDTVLCSQVLEHVSDPRAVLGECSRVLKEGGMLVISAPQYWEMHEKPHDFFRYTLFGMRALLNTAGFEILQEWSECSGGAIAPLSLNLALGAIGKDLPYHRSLWFNALKAPFYLVSNLAGVILQRLLPNSDDVANYTLAARKRGTGGA